VRPIPYTRAPKVATLASASINQTPTRAD
jgi:hypothetical protein